MGRFSVTPLAVRAATANLQRRAAGIADPVFRQVHASAAPPPPAPEPMWQPAERIARALHIAEDHAAVVKLIEAAHANGHLRALRVGSELLFQSGEVARFFDRAGRKATDSPKRDHFGRPGEKVQRGPAPGMGQSMTGSQS